MSEGASRGARRRFARATQELVGLARGVLADRVVNDAEVHAMGVWLHAHPDVLGEWPANVLAHRIVSIYADGIVSAEEREELGGFLAALTGTELEALAEPEEPPHSGRLPLDHPAPILSFQGREFVLTGRLAFGSPSDCEDAIRSRGGVCRHDLTPATDYLVVASIAHPDWLQSPWGTKIATAMRLRTSASRPAIVGEEHWVHSLADAAITTTPHHRVASRLRLVRSTPAPPPRSLESLLQESVALLQRRTNPQ